MSKFKDASKVELPTKKACKSKKMPKKMPKKVPKKVPIKGSKPNNLVISS